MLKSLLLTAAFVLPTAALAAHSGVTLNANKSITSFHGTAGKQTLPNWHPPKGKKKIIDTFGAGDAYNAGSGWTISNAQSESGIQQWFAYAITPKKSTNVTEIAEAIGYVAGTESVTVALLADNGGSPGNVLGQKTVKSLETFGDCCGVAVAKFKTGIPVTGGTTYWVAAILPKKSQATSWDVWNFSTADSGTDTAAFYNGTWNVSTGNSYTAFAVYGD